MGGGGGGGASCPWEQEEILVFGLRDFLEEVAEGIVMEAGTRPMMWLYEYLAPVHILTCP